MSSVNPGDGWRLLSEGELIPENAEWEKHKGDWVKVDSHYHVGGKWTAKQWVPFRVPIEPIGSTGVEVTTSGPYVSIDVHREEVQRLESHITELLGQLEDGYRDAKEQQAEIERLKAELETVKQPQTGQYWIHDKGGDKAYFIGKCPDDVMVWQIEGDSIEHGNLDWSGWHHEPRCTGWDWQPSPEPEWFDLTPFGEHVLRPCVDHSLCSDQSDYWYTGVKWPQGSTIAKAKTWPSGWCKFRCLLKDAPPELVAKSNADKCIHTFDCNAGDHSDACPASVPAESLDDWVTQDRVPYRKEFDQCKWDSFDEWNSFQDVYPHYRHGFVGVSGRKLEVRCRRRDLPPMPQQPKTETVVFHEVIVDSPETGNRYLCWAEHPDKRQGDIPTGRTETREVVR